MGGVGGVGKLHCLSDNRYSFHCTVSCVCVYAYKDGWRAPGLRDGVGDLRPVLLLIQRMYTRAVLYLDLNKSTGTKSIFGSSLLFVVPLATK